jgi:hypothetical protein
VVIIQPFCKFPANTLQVSSYFSYNIPAGTIGSR